MFEKEARKWVKEHTKIDYKASYGEFPIEPSARKSFKAGAEFGYNKANEEGKVVVEHFEAYGQCRDSRRIASLEKENAELKDKLSNLESVAEVRLANWQKLDKENKELKSIADFQTSSNMDRYFQLKRSKERLTKAEEIIKGLYFIIQGRIDYENNIGIADEMWRAKQFWKEEDE